MITDSQSNKYSEKDLLDSYINNTISQIPSQPTVEEIFNIFSEFEENNASLLIHLRELIDKVILQIKSNQEKPIDLTTLKELTSLVSQHFNFVDDLNREVPKGTVKENLEFFDNKYNVRFDCKLPTLFLFYLLKDTMLEPHLIFLPDAENTNAHVGLFIKIALKREHPKNTGTLESSGILIHFNGKSSDLEKDVKFATGSSLPYLSHEISFSQEGFTTLDVLFLISRIYRSWILSDEYIFSTPSNNVKVMLAELFSKIDIDKLSSKEKYLIKSYVKNLLQLDIDL